jgi:inhibitor of cysteine peptidase
MSIGESLKISLPSNPTTGYSWSITRQGDPTVLHLSSDYYPTSTLTGSGGTETWNVIATKKGNETLIFNYARPWENVAPVRTVRYNFSVRV